jgi:hypothetical protein
MSEVPEAAGVKKQLVWLASYPKSGNTWFRAFISVLLKNENLDLNNIETDGIFSGKRIMEEILDLDADFLTANQIEHFRRTAYRHLSEKSQELLYIKIHDAFTYSQTDKLPLIPEEPTRLAIYIIRNPLDVALSLVNHIGLPVDEVITSYLINPEGYFNKPGSGGSYQFGQPLGTWSGHVESWLRRPSFPVHFIRYEDMIARPFETFKGAVEAIGNPVSDEQIRKAIEATEFEKLQQKEQAGGFKEKQEPSVRFFFKGQAGRWKEELNEAQIEKIRQANKPMMQEFGYW